MCGYGPLLWPIVVLTCRGCYPHTGFTQTSQKNSPVWYQGFAQCMHQTLQSERMAWEVWVGYCSEPSRPVTGGGPGWLSTAPDVDIFVLESNMPCLSLVPIDQWMQDYMPNTHCLQGSWVSGSGGSPMITWRKMWGPGMPIFAIPVWVTR